ncbi:MAG: hypothetical protein QM619_12230 [Micropruina sp.]|uniref:hypothetical protein n=1 Tax=Micropruina sp. TaxID=2737536 RepID=UPI0039E4858B
MLVRLAVAFFVVVALCLSGAPAARADVAIPDAAARANSWVDSRVGYSQATYYSNQYGRYRQDCSGFVSMVWGLGSSLTTSTLPSVSHPIAKDDLATGDILLDNTGGDAHVVVFDRWANSARTKYLAWEQTPPQAVYHELPYPYWSGYGPYNPYRKNGASTNQAPQGSFDAASGGAGTVSVSGWVFDRDVVPSATAVHVYIGGPAGSGEGHDLGAATGSRPDVAAAYTGAGPNHGFSSSIVTGKRGRQTVYVYAINQPAGENPLIGQRDVVIGDPSPVGFFDQATSPTPGKVRVVGWAFDPNSPKNAVRLHAYVGGPAGQGEFHDLGTTGVARADVKAAHPETGESQGFDTTFATSRTGTQTVYVYALNLSGTPGDNVLLGSRSTTISTAPTPKVDGELAVGSVVSAQTGTWPSGTTLKYVWLRDGVQIPGATASSYQLVAADADRAMSVKVTGTVPGADPVEVFSGQSPKVLTVDTPKYNGDVAVGRSLLAVPLSWTDGTTFRYLWLRDGASIDGATGQTYTPTASDEGHRLGLAVTGTLPGYSTITRIASTDFRVLKVGTPTISGTPRVGETIQADPGDWSDGSTFIYKWLRDGSTIGEGRSPTYAIDKADLGKRLSVQVIGWATETATLGSTSDETSSVEPPLTFTATPTPTITGSARVGSTLTASVGGWRPASAYLSVQWRRNGKSISNANHLSYVLESADKGAKISVTVTGTQAGYTSVSKTSRTTGKVTAGTIEASTPKVSGTVKVGNQLTAKPGTWTPTAVQFSYQWYRSGKAIRGANHNTYILVKSDKGKRIKVKVTGKLAGYTTITEASAQTGKTK